ncbi:MAG: alpha/beta hydrolase [Thiolinea sp.]
MYITVNQHHTYVATGGKDFDRSLPTVVFLHGSGLDHRCWVLQTRWFAFHGFSVLAPDFPGHSLSGGAPLTSIEAMADWVWTLLDHQGVDQAVLVGHSQGALVALEAAARQPQRVRGISLIGTAAAIPVNAQLLEMAQQDRPAAAAAMLNWGFGELHQFGRSAVPGQAPIGIGYRIMCNNPLAVDLQACQDYQGGETAATHISAPAQLILARQDRMTPLQAGRKLAELLPQGVTQVELDCGHMVPMEAPDATLEQLKTHVQRCYG